MLLVERRWPPRAEQALLLLYTMRKWESEVLGDDLFDVWALDIGGLFDLCNFQDLKISISRIEWGYKHGST
jgi:hypothetical protein